MPATTTSADAGVGAECAAPRRGRPRSAGVDEALLAATLELATEVGINRMSMDVLAQRAGVSKATIYRRWPSKEALVLDALQHAIKPFEQVDTGTFRGDLDVYLGELAERMTNGSASDILPHLIEVSVRDDVLRASLDDYVRMRRQPLRTIVERAIGRGELSADTDVDILLDVVLSPFIYRRLLSHDVIDADFVRRLLALVLPDA
jgi:AcrR family transcriptional regulator